MSNDWVVKRARAFRTLHTLEEADSSIWFWRLRHTAVSLACLMKPTSCPTMCCRKVTSTAPTLLQYLLTLVVEVRRTQSLSQGKPVGHCDQALSRHRRHPDPTTEWFRLVFEREGAQSVPQRAVVDPGPCLRSLAIVGFSYWLAEKHRRGCWPEVFVGIVTTTGWWDRSVSHALHRDFSCSINATMIGIPLAIWRPAWPCCDR